MNVNKIADIRNNIRDLILQDDWPTVVNLIKDRNPGTLLYIHAYLPTLLENFDMEDIELILRLVYVTSLFSSLETAASCRESISVEHLN